MWNSLTAVRAPSSNDRARQNSPARPRWEEKSMILRRFSSLAAALALTSVLAIAHDSGDVQHIRFTEDVVALEYVGNVNNSGANSSQFGYFSFVTQLPAFNGNPEDAAHANFTFFTGSCHTTSNDEWHLAHRGPNGHHYRVSGYVNPQLCGSGLLSQRDTHPNLDDAATGNSGYNDRRFRRREREHSHG